MNHMSNKAIEIKSKGMNKLDKVVWLWIAGIRGRSPIAKGEVRSEQDLRDGMDNVWAVMYPSSPNYQTSWKILCAVRERARMYARAGYVSAVRHAACDLYSDLSGVAR